MFKLKWRLIVYASNVLHIIININLGIKGESSLHK